MTLKTLRSSILVAAALLLVFLSAPTVRAQDDPNAPIKNLSFQNADIRTVLGFLAD